MDMPTEDEYISKSISVLISHLSPFCTFFLSYSPLFFFYLVSPDMISRIPRTIGFTILRIYGFFMAGNKTEDGHSVVVVMNMSLETLAHWAFRLGSGMTQKPSPSFN